MPVPASITDLSTTAGSNSPPGSESPATLDDYIRTLSSFIAQLRDGKLAASAVSPYMLTVLDETTPANARVALGTNDAGTLITGTLPNARLDRIAPAFPTYVNSFTNNGGVHMRSGKVVTIIMGTARTTSPAAGTDIFTLPSGMFPSNNIYGTSCFYTQSGSFGTAYVEVTTAGIVRFLGGGVAGAASFTLNGVISYVSD